MTTSTYYYDEYRRPLFTFIFYFIFFLHYLTLIMTIVFLALCMGTHTRLHAYHYLFYFIIISPPLYYY